MREIEIKETMYRDILFTDIPKKGYARHYKTIETFYEHEYLPNKEFYKANLGYYQKSFGESIYTLDFRKLDKYRATKKITTKHQNLIYGKFYFARNVNPENKNMGNLLKKYQASLNKISELSELVATRKIRGKIYYQILARSEIELLQNLKGLGFKEDGLQNLLESNSDEKLDIEELDHYIKSDVLERSIKNEPIGSTKPTIINNPIYKIKKSKGVTGELNPATKNVNIAVVQRKHSIVHFLKGLYENTCQICGEQLEIRNGIYMSEVHHIRPLGKRHKGADVIENMIVVCPNHHTLFDRGAITIDLNKKIVRHVNQKNSLNEKPLILKHKIIQDYVDYHNQNLFLNSIT